MKQYFGNYLGLCVGNNDPEKRGRVQIFIPHIMPALFKDWNEAQEDTKEEPVDYDSEAEVYHWNLGTPDNIPEIEIIYTDENPCQL